MKQARFTKKKFGQHFLQDLAIAENIVESAEIEEGDAVLEIGPGKGVLTKFLLRKNCALYAVELDRDLIPELRAKFGRETRFHLIESDILKLDMKSLFGILDRKVIVVSNLPYNISTAVINLLVENRNLFSRAVLMLQKEVAVRLLASPGSRDYGLTTLNLGLYSTGEKLMDVPPEVFVPPPEVMSSVIKLFFREEPLYPLEYPSVFHKITGVSFRKRRKMIRNSLFPYILSSGLGEEDTSKVFESAGIVVTARPEEIPLRSWVSLSNELGRHGIKEQVNEK